MHKNKYYILFYPGSCGNFLISVLLKAFKLSPGKNNISTKGDCHDLGNGIWSPTNHVDYAGWIWEPDKLSGKIITVGHINNLHQIKRDYPDVKIVLIGVDISDIKNMVFLRFYKTMSPMIRPTEYDKFIKKFNIKNWPPKETVIKKPETIKKSFIKYDTQWYKEWFSDIDLALVDIIVPFKFLIGHNPHLLQKIVEEKFCVKVGDEILSYIQQYQQINQKYLSS